MGLLFLILSEFWKPAFTFFTGFLCYTTGVLRVCAWNHWTIECDTILQTAIKALKIYYVSILSDLLKCSIGCKSDFAINHDLMLLSDWVTTVQSKHLAQTRDNTAKVILQNTIKTSKISYSSKYQLLYSDAKVDGKSDFVYQMWPACIIWMSYGRSKQQEAKA